MDYDLAKQLKDAGFEYKPRLHAMILPDNSIRTISTTDEEAKDGICLPLLEELIEACGDKFSNLMKLHILTQTWSANAYESDINCKGETPEEAVAHLFLKLNKK